MGSCHTCLTRQTSCKPRGQGGAVSAWERKDQMHRPEKALLQVEVHMINGAEWVILILCVPTCQMFIPWSCGLTSPVPEKHSRNNLRLTHQTKILQGILLGQGFGQSSWPLCLKLECLCWLISQLGFRKRLLDGAWDWQVRPFSLGLLFCRMGWHERSY
jgi:hypothetical protein